MNGLKICGTYVGWNFIAFLCPLKCSPDSNHIAIYYIMPINLSVKIRLVLPSLLSPLFIK
jgi:hypothetical protein